MPPKVKFTKEEIIAAAVDVTREKGIDAVTTRDIATKLGVSTRPIFTYFQSMDEVRTAIRHRAWHIYDVRVRQGLLQKTPFLGFGLQYLQFAKEEPQLYRLLFLSSSQEGNEMEIIRTSKELIRPLLMQVYHMDAQTADRYFRDMWLVAHSLATLIVTGRCPYTDAQIREILTEFSLSICKAIKEIPGFSEGTIDEERVFRSLIEHEQKEETE